MPTDKFTFVNPANILETDIEDAVYRSLLEDPSGRELRDRGLLLRGHPYKQVPLGVYGTANLIAWQYYPGKDNYETGESEHVIRVVEFKRVPLQLDDVAQLCRYAQAISELASFQKAIVSKSGVYSFRVFPYLIGPSIADERILPVMESLSFGWLYTYHLDLLRGLRFTQHRKTTGAEEFTAAQQIINRDARPIIRESLFPPDNG